MSEPETLHERKIFRTERIVLSHRLGNGSSGEIVIGESETWDKKRTVQLHVNSAAGALNLTITELEALVTMLSRCLERTRAIVALDGLEKVAT